MTGPSFLRIRKDLLQRVTAAAEKAFPQECCGLLAGKNTGEGLTVTRVVPADNVTEGRAEDSFEVDPQAHFDLLRALEGSGEFVLGHYHSHPGGPARPSATDLARAYDRGLAWVIVAVADGKAVETRAHILAPGGGDFTEIPIEATDT